MKTNPKVLIVDDEKNILKTMAICFDELGFNSTLFSDPQEAIEALQNEVFDIAFVDLKMSPVDGMHVLKEIKFCSPHTTSIIMTAHGSIESAVEAIKQGAYHYLQKPFDYLELQLFANKVLEYHSLKTELVSLKNDHSNFQYPGNIITRNPKMREMVNLAESSADTNLSILIEGESGTGKELFANLVHQNSSRNNKLFVKVNCAALPENLLESELFGHVKGAFTGALKDRKGRFELANDGTIFLDEIAEIAPPLQAKLLRVLQNKEFERVGESTTLTTNVRIITATNKNLDEAIKEGTFREDLFYRLNSVRIKLTPLRERPEDIPILINFFINKFSEGKNINIEPKALMALRSYRWSGNVRELENTIERIVVLAKNSSINLRELPEEIRIKNGDSFQPFSLEEVEKQHIKKVLQLAKDLNEASDILGIDPATLWRKRKKYEL